MAKRKNKKMTEKQIKWVSFLIASPIILIILILNAFLLWWGLTWWQALLADFVPLFCGMWVMLVMQAESDMLKKERVNIMEKSEYDEARPIDYPYDSGMIGSVWKLKVNCLGNPAGTIGYVFNEYADFDDPFALGVQIIWPNGEYDGFSIKEQEDFLEYVGYDMRYVDYKFTNVITMSRDYDRGYWAWD